MAAIILRVALGWICLSILTGGITQGALTSDLQARRRLEHTHRALGETVDLHFRNVPLEDVLRHYSTQYGLEFDVRNKEILKQDISVRAEQCQLEDTLDLMFRARDYRTTILRDGTIRIEALQPSK